MNLGSPPARYSPDFLARALHAVTQADDQNHKRTGDIDHPHSLTVRKRTIHPRVAFTADDATPSVAEGTYFVTANANATTITDFDDPEDGQVITVEIGDANTTIDFTSSGLKGNAGADWSPTTGDHMVCRYNGTDWLCAVSDNTA